MARPASRHPTDRELQILKVLWESGPSGLGQIFKELDRQRPVARTTVATILKMMLEKGLVKRTSGSKGYLWSARVSQDATTRGSLRKLLNHFFDGSARKLVAHLLEDDKLTDQEREEIRRMIDAYDDK